MSKQWMMSLFVLYSATVYISCFTY